MKIACLVAGLLLLPLSGAAEDFTISAPPGIRPALQELVDQFQKTKPDLTITILSANPSQFLVPTPETDAVDLLISDDSSGMEALRKQRLFSGTPKVFAIGRIVLWVRRDSGVDLHKGLEALLDKEADQIAIPNPSGDPTGQRVRQALGNAQLWGRVERKLLVAEDSAQAVLLVADGTSNVAIIPLALALTPPLKGSGFYYQIHDESYHPLVHSYAVLTGGNVVVAQEFAKFMESREGQKVLKKFGFSIPTTKPPLKPGEKKPAPSASAVPPAR
jgi:molybdate transport system substrate-binding protein